MASITQDELNKILWSAADSSRGTVDSSVFKDYVLSLLFYKYISDLHEVEYKKLKDRYGNDAERIEMRLQNSRFIMPKGTSFKDIYIHQSESNIGELLNIALRKIEDANEALKGIFTVDFNDEKILGPTSQRSKMIRDLLNDFNKIDLTEVGDDILGNSYMYMIEKFGSEAGKKAGEFFTPKQICKLVAKLANPKEGDKICDPTCGSAGLLITAGNEVRENGSTDYALYGQEKTGTTYNLARMNMFLHKQDSARIEWGDTINEPKLTDDDGLMKFDVIVANPPFSLDKWADEGKVNNDKYNRFHRGMPPASKGDYAFITHMIETAKAKEGRVAVVVPHGVLFRGSAEGRIRKAFIEENILDAVIGLPAGLFQTTGIPVAILVFDRSREKGGANENRKDILFIDASREFVPGKNQNNLSDEHIAKIVDTYKNRKEIEKYSHIATIKEIEENEYNLNIPRYVDTYEEEEIIDIRSTRDEIKKLQDEISSIEQKMTKYLKELDLD